MNLIYKTFQILGKKKLNPCGTSGNGQTVVSASFGYTSATRLLKNRKSKNIMTGDHVSSFKFQHSGINLLGSSLVVILDQASKLYMIELLNDRRRPHGAMSTM